MKRLDDLAKLNKLPDGAKVKVTFVGTSLTNFPKSENEYVGLLRFLGTTSDTGMNDHIRFSEDARKCWPGVGAIYAKDLLGIGRIIGRGAAREISRFLGAVLYWAEGDRDTLRYYHRHDEEFEARYMELSEFQKWTAWAQRECEFVQVEIQVGGEGQIYKGMDLLIGYGSDYESAYQMAIQDSSH